MTGGQREYWNRQARQVQAKVGSFCVSCLKSAGKKTSRQISRRGLKRKLVVFLESWGHLLVAVRQGVLKAAGCGLKKKVTASCGKSCLNLGPLQSGVWAVVFNLFKALINTQSKGKPASCLDGQASRQYPFHVWRHSGLGLVSGCSAASFGTRLLSHTVGDKGGKMGEDNHLTLVNSL